MSLSLISSSFASATELWKFGTQERTARGTPLMMSAWCGGASPAVNFSTPRLMGAAAGYQVTGGKTLIITRVLFRADGGGFAFSVGYSDSDRGVNNATDGVNPVNFDASVAIGLGVFAAAAANVIYDISTYFAVPAAKFPRLVGSISASTAIVEMFGHEV